MKIKVEANGEAIDIPSMREMSIEEYESYLKNDLLFVDHHDVLRSVIGEYPIAVTKEQMETLIVYLKNMKVRMDSNDT